MSSGSRFAANAHATGTFAELPLAHALVYIRAKRLSGVLDLRAPGGRQSWVVFWRGGVSSVTTTPTIERFGVVAFEMGVASAATIDDTALESARTKRPQADILLERGDISKATYHRVVEEQMRRRVQHLFTYPPSTMFLFREGKTSISSPQELIDVLAPVWRGILEFPPEHRVREVLATVGVRPIRLEDETVLEYVGLDASDASVVLALASGPKTVAELRASADVPAHRVDLVVYLLLIARCATADGGIAAPSGAMWAVAKKSVSREIAKAEPPRLRGPADLGIAGIKRRAAAIADEGPFEALGIEDGATVEAVRAAFLRLRRLWNPDRLPEELEEVRAEVTNIFLHMTEAHRVLTEPTPRNRTARSSGSR